MSLYNQLIEHIANELTQEPTKAISRDGLHAGQLHVLNSLAKRNVIIAGRRVGKTHLAIHYIREQLAQGKRGWYCAVTYGNVESVWRTLVNTFRGQDIRKSTRDIETSTGGYIGVRSLSNYDALRGSGLDFIIIDECAFVDPTAWYEVLQPMLLDNDGDAMFMSSPKGKNWFYDIAQLGYDDTIPEWKSFHFTTYDNPHIKPETIDKLKKTMTERVFSEEILAEFNDSSGSVFRNVRPCATLEKQTDPIEGHTYIFSVDWGKSNDFTVICVLDATTSEMVAMDRFSQIDYTIQQQRLKAMYQHWQPIRIYAEENSIGAPNIDALRRDGMPVTPFYTSAKSKRLIIESLALAFEQGNIRVINDPVLIHELVSFEINTTPAGNIKYEAPTGAHDDIVLSLAIGWYYIARTIPDEIPVITF